MNESLRLGLDRVDENGKPTPWNIENFKRGCELIEGDTVESALKKLAPEIQKIKDLFLDGNVEELLKILASTAPVAYQDSGYSLGNAQVLNDYASSALARLIGEDRIRPLMYNYQSSLGQDSGDVALDRLFAAAGLSGDEAQKAALAEIARKNPDPNDVLKEQQEALRTILNPTK